MSDDIKIFLGVGVFILLFIGMIAFAGDRQEQRHQALNLACIEKGIAPKDCK